MISRHLEIQGRRRLSLKFESGRPSCLRVSVEKGRDNGEEKIEKRQDESQQTNNPQVEI